MYCPNCGAQNAQNAEKCLSCGKALPRLSPSGEPIAPTTETPTERPAGWPNNSNPPPPQIPGGNFQPGQPGSQYSFQPPTYGQPGPYNYNQPPYNQPPLSTGYPGYNGGGYVPYTSYSTPADRVGVASGGAGFWPRFGAYIIDSIIVGILTSIVTAVPFFIWIGNFVGHYAVELSNICDNTANNYNNAACNRRITQILQNNNELGNLLGLVFGTFFLALLVYVLYYTLQTARGATIGKRVFGLKVVGPDGKAPGFGRSLLRHTVGYFISSLFFCLGFIWIAFDPQHQGWHDKIAATYVIQANNSNFN